MKSILISIKPKYVAEILNHRKTIEIRKTCPKCDLPIDVYIYCTKGSPTLMTRMPEDDYVLNGKVVAKFTLRKVEVINGLFDEFSREYDIPGRTRLSREACVDIDDLTDYLTKGRHNNNDYGVYGYAWHISDLVIFDEPKVIWQMRFFSKPKKVRKIGHYDILESKQISKAPQSWCFTEDKK